MLIPVGLDGGIQKMLQVVRVSDSKTGDSGVIYPNDFKIYEDVQVAFLSSGKNVRCT